MQSIDGEQSPGHRQLSREEIGYISGIIDGEGYLSIVKRRNGKHRYVATLSISNIHRPLLAMLKGLVGGDITAPRMSGGRRQQAYVLRITGTGLRRLLPKVLESLVVKRPNAENVMTFFSIQRAGGYYSAEEKSALDNLYLRAKQLNGKGRVR